MKKIKIAVTDQDQKCLMMLWRWKLLSTKALSVSIYPERTAYRCYRRLLLLEENDLLFQLLHGIKRPLYGIWVNVA